MKVLNKICLVCSCFLIVYSILTKNPLASAGWFIVTLDYIRDVLNQE